jgi:antitoxin component YwqK of YwqJK toxin-antitoxin module
VRTPLRIVCALLVALAPETRAAEPDLRCPPGTKLWIGTRESRCETPSGVAQGPIFGFYTDGTLRFYGTSRRGKSHGPWTHWNPDGSLSVEANYADGELVGAFRRFDAHGVLQSEGHHDPQGRMHGPWVRYWPNGRVRARWTMEHGQQHGPVATFYENGEKKSEGQRANAQPDGDWSWYDEDGNVASRCRYDAGRVVSGTCGEPSASADRR